jgi:two-component system sensor histidine kinase KdpD
VNADSDRPSPEALLREATQEGRGRLKVFLGAAPGVGKTYEMLSEGATRKRAGVDVVIGIVETHGRAETQALVEGLSVMPRKRVDYQGRTLSEMDVDAILERHPTLALVDELAHTNAPGCRHAKRWQDVEELLAAGIDVYSTLNIQHVESLNDVVASFTHVRVRETVPDRVLDGAEIEIVDIPPDELIDRLRKDPTGPRSQQLKRLLDRVNGVLSIIVGVEYPSSYVRREMITQARDELQAILADEW